MRRLLWFLLLVLVFGAGVYLTYQFTKPAEVEIIEESTVLLNKVEKVFKLVSIEGDFVETYKGGDIKNLTFYLPFPTKIPSAKQAVINVKGKVLVGFDMNDMQIDMDSLNKVVKLSNLPEPQILSVDHELSYSNIDEGWFNTFEAADYNRINKEAKNKLIEAAEKAGLLEKAKNEGNQMLEVIKFIVEYAGWTVVLEGTDGMTVPIDSLLM